MLICNAVLTDADGARPGDVRIENGVITAVGEGLSAGGDTVLDLSLIHISSPGIWPMKMRSTML